jgi:hypothetical protein
VNLRTIILRELRSNAVLLASAFVLLIAGILAHGQAVEKGTITGLVNDSSGAIISGARVSLYNMATDIVTETTTNSQGLFVSPPLDPGDYDIQVKVAGFKTVHQSFRLEVGQRASANITLPVGNSSETVEVADNNQEILETASSTIENLRTEQAVKDLPLNGRNFNELFSLGAGAIPTTTQSVSIPYTQQRGPSYFAINGSRPQENRTLLDGIGDNENHNSMTALFPPIDAIQEFSEVTTDADARYGRGNGSTINVIYKSGTAHYHGDVFEFLRNTALDSRNYFVSGAKPALRQNEFGAVLGGPLSFKRHDSNPNTFFFVDYAGKRLAQGQTNITSVPDVTITSTGYDFSAYSSVATVKNPSTKVAYSNNFVPISDPLIDSTGANILKFYEKYASPNISGKTISSNYLYVPLLITNEDDFDVKIDRKFSEKDSGFVRYSQGSTSVTQPGILPPPLVGDVICGPATDPAHQIVINETHIISPTIINTVRYGWTRFFVNAQNWDKGLQLASSSNLNIPGVLISGNSKSDGLPVYTFSGYTPIGDAGNSPTQIGTNNYQWDDDLTLVRGKHSLDLGFDLIRLEYNMFQTNAEHGSEAFGKTYTGLAWSDLLFGAPASGSYSFPSEVGLRESDLSFYVQDNYTVNNRLTLNIGVHYENFLGWPWTEVNDKEYDFVPSISANTLIRVGTKDLSRSGLSGNNYNFAPRLGLAYKITNKTAFHAGYGIYYAAPDVGVSSTLAANVPTDDYWAFNNNTGTYAASNNGIAFVYASNGFAHTAVTAAQITSAPVTGEAGVVNGAWNIPVFAVDPNAKTPYTEQWHAAIEQQIPYSTVLKFAYVGSRGVHLDDFRDINTSPIVASGSTTSSIIATRPYGSGFLQQISLLETREISSYNALQVTAERRAHGLGFLASYTYSHALDEGSGESASEVNSYNIRYNYGNSDYNVPNRFVASASYQLPFKGSGRFSSFERGWQVNAIGQFFDGLPFSVSSSSGVGDGFTPRADLVAGQNPVLPSGQRTLSRWFNTAAFTTAAAGTWGNSGRNILQGPGTKTVDFSIFKDTHLTEGKILQLRAETFNLANTPQFNNPGATVGSPSIGVISSATSDVTFQRTERQVQFAAKINF